LTSPPYTGKRVAVVGGGLAGIAAAEALSRFPIEVYLIESKRALGGRAGGFRDESTSKVIDRCQHVAMGCCTNFLGLCRRLDVSSCFRCDKKLHFIDAEGVAHSFQSNDWLPAPLHLAGAFQNQKYLSSVERRSIASALWKMGYPSTVETFSEWTMLRWLEAQGQSESSIRRFWEVVLVSALGAPLAEVSFSAARKIFVDGFLRNRNAYQVYVPNAPLQDVFDIQAAQRLGERGVQILRQSAVREIRFQEEKFILEIGSGAAQTFDDVICAVPWHQANKICSQTIQTLIPKITTTDQIESSPISSVHLWFDVPITELPHAVLLDRLSQWIFYHGQRQLRGSDAHYYQVVISASHELVGGNAQQISEEVVTELITTFPTEQKPTLLDFQLVTEKQAVFAATPELEQLRPTQGTLLTGLALAGDWTKTGWPSTMEGAVRSGYAAAEAIMRKYGHHQQLADPDLPTEVLPKLIWGLSSDS